MEEDVERETNRHFARACGTRRRREDALQAQENAGWVILSFSCRLAL